MGAHGTHDGCGRDRPAGDVRIPARIGPRCGRGTRPNASGHEVTQEVALPADHTAFEGDSGAGADLRQRSIPPRAPSHVREPGRPGIGIIHRGYPRVSTGAGIASPGVPKSTDGPVRSRIRGISAVARCPVGSYRSRYVCWPPVRAPIAPGSGRGVGVIPTIPEPVEKVVYPPGRVRDLSDDRAPGGGRGHPGGRSTYLRGAG